MSNLDFCLASRQDFLVKFDECLNPFEANSNAALSVLPEQIPVQRGYLEPATQVITKRIASGLTLVAIDEPKPITNLSLFIKAGSRFEHGLSIGASHFLKRLAFRSTEKKYFYPLIRDFDVLGNEFSSSNTHEYVSYSMTGLRSQQLNMAQTLGAVWEPLAEEWEIERVRNEVRAETQAAFDDPKRILFDAIHRHTFRDQSLANSPIAPHYALSQISPLTIRQYVNTHYQPSRQFLIGNGTSLDELESLASNFEATDTRKTIESVIGPNIYPSMFPILTQPGSIINDENKYLGGGETLIPGVGSTHIIVAAEGVSIRSGINTQLTAATLRFLLGGGSLRLYSLIPGLGPHSRLGKRMISAAANNSSPESNNPWIREAFAFNLNYAETGLFGIYIHASPKHVPDLANLIEKEFSALKTISEDEVVRARNQLKMSVLSHLYADPLATAEFYASNVDNFGSAITPSQFASEIDKVDVSAVAELAKRISSSKLTVAALGDIKGLPRFS